MAIEITRHIDYAIRWSVNVETHMVSVQRLLQFAALREESQKENEETSLAISGQLDFNDVEMRYNPDLPPALIQLTFSIQPGEKVAVVGRTGAGKSSLYQLLLGFRKADAGCVRIDGQDISQLDPCSLRRKINVVLQQPFVVETDTIRDNLDPRK